MTVESLFPLATSWEVATLGDVCRRGGGDVQTGPFGSQLHAADYVPVGIPSIMPMNIGDNRISEEGIARITPEDARRLSKYLVKTGDIVYSRRGDVERRALVREPEDGWLCGTGCLRVRFGEKSVVHPPYAAYYLGHPSVREWIVRHAQGATMPNLNTSILSALPFVLPSIGEQEQVASVLTALDDKIELNRQINQTLEQIAQTIFKSWFVDFEPVKAKIEAKAAGRDPERAAMCAISGKLEPELDQLPPEQYQQLAATAALFPDELVESELGLIPVGWEVGSFEQCCERVESGGTPSRSQPEYWNGSVPWLTSGEVRDVIVLGTKEKISAKGLASSSAKLWPAMSTVVAMYGATAGQICLLANEMAANQACCALIPKKDYRAFVFFSARRSIEDLAGKASGSAQQNLNKSLVANHAVVMPFREGANVFERTISPLIEQWISNQNESQSLSNLRDTLLPKLLSGELTVESPRLEATA